MSGKKRLYAITERGMAVFRTLSFQRYLDKIAKSLRASAVETAPTQLTLSTAEAGRFLLLGCSSVGCSLSF
jgi:hypothetical protein